MPQAADGHLIESVSQVTFRGKSKRVLGHDGGDRGRFQIEPPGGDPHEDVPLRKDPNDLAFVDDANRAMFPLGHLFDHFGDAFVGSGGYRFGRFQGGKTIRKDGSRDPRRRFGPFVVMEVRTALLASVGARDDLSAAGWAHRQRFQWWRRHSYSTIQVSPALRRAFKSPLPCFSMAEEICCCIKSPYSGRGTSLNTPTGTGYSG